jgi:hypothetical protein
VYSGGVVVGVGIVVVGVEVVVTVVEVGVVVAVVSPSVQEAITRLAIINNISGIIYRNFIIVFPA